MYLKRFRLSTDNLYRVRFDPEFWGVLIEGEGEGEGAGAGQGESGEGQGAQGEGDGQQAADTVWRDGLPDDLKPHAERFTSVADIIKGNLDLRKQVSSAIIPPGKDADDDEISAYRAKIGVPEAADKYEFEAPEGHEANDIDIAFQAAMGKVMHQYNTTAAAAKALSAAYNEFSAGVVQAQLDVDKQYAEQSEVELRKAWPGAEYDTNKEHAERAAAQMFGDDIEEIRHLETKAGTFVLDDPRMMRALASIGREMAEGGLVPPLTEGDRDAASDQITALRDKAAEAKAAGNSKEANRLYQQEQALIAKTGGNRAIVGAGRTA